MTDADILKIRDAELAIAEARANLLDAQIADLKQQLHAYREYHDAREAYEKVFKESVSYLQQFDADDRLRKANQELQVLRNVKK